MNDDDLLRGYRPAGPPPELRARIAASSAKALAERPRLRDWLPALAAAALIALLQVLAASIRDRTFDQIAAPDQPPSIEVPAR